MTATLGTDVESSVSDRIKHPEWCDRSMCDVADPDVIAEGQVGGIHAANLTGFETQDGHHWVTIYASQSRTVDILDGTITDHLPSITVLTEQADLTLEEADRLATAIRDASERLGGPWVGGDAA